LRHVPSTYPLCEPDAAFCVFQQDKSVDTLKLGLWLDRKLNNGGELLVLVNRLDVPASITVKHKNSGALRARKLSVVPINFFAYSLFDF
jgi:hypothetical protein